MTDFKAKVHQIQFRLVFPPDPAGELTALPRPLSWIWGAASRQGRAGLAKRRESGRRRGGRGKWRGGKGRAPKLLLNHGSSDPCYVTVCCGE